MFEATDAKTKINIFHRPILLSLSEILEKIVAELLRRRKRPRLASSFQTALSLAYINVLDPNSTRNRYVDHFGALDAGGKSAEVEMLENGSEVISQR